MIRFNEIKGITLVALVVTIIVLLILAAVSINLVLGENGIITRAKQSSETIEIASIKEKAELIRDGLEINRLTENTQELTKNIYINALNVEFKDSIVEGSRVIVDNNKYVIFVKSDLEIEVIKNDGKTLAKGEMKLDYNVTENGRIEIYPRIGGVESYKAYSERILEGKTQNEKEQMYIDGMLYWCPEDKEAIFPGIENPTFDDFVDFINSGVESEPKITKEEVIEHMKMQMEVESFDDCLILARVVKPENFDFNSYGEIEIKCPNGDVIMINTDTLCVIYRIYDNGDYKFIGSVKSGTYTGVSAETTVSVQLDESIFEALKLIVEIKILEENEEFRLSSMLYGSSYNHDFVIDWGDGTAEERVTNENSQTIKHTYANAGNYILKLTGKCEDFGESFNNQIVRIRQWGDTELKRIYFSFCENLVEIAEPNINSFADITTFEDVFQGCSGLTSIPENLFVNCPKVTSFEGTFAQCNAIEEIPENLFANCPNAINFKSTFNQCINLRSIPQNLFKNCKKVETFRLTFNMCNNLEGQPIRLWEEGRTGIDEEHGGLGCYYDCTKLENYEQIPEHWKCSASE